MARTKAVLGTGARLADYLSASLLARVVPAEVINEVLDAHGRNSQRLRSLPAVAGVYYCIALSLYPEAAYEEVFAAVAQGLAWAAGATEPTRVSKVSISLARSKIGAAPLQDLVRRCCMPMADERFHPDAFYRGMRLVAMDGSNFELPDEADNDAYFGRSGRPGQPLRHRGEYFLVPGLGIQAQRDAVVDPYHGRKAAQPLRVATVDIKHLVDDLGRNDTGQKTGAQIVRQPCTRSQHCLRSCHGSPLRCDGVDSAMKTTNLTVLRLHMSNRIESFVMYVATAWRTTAPRRGVVAALAFASLMTLALFSPRVEAFPILSAGSATVAVGDTFTVPVSITAGAGLSSYQFDLSFNALVLQVIGITESAFFAQGDSTVFIPGVIDNTRGQLLGLSDALLFQLPVNGSGILANIEFTAISAGTSALTLSNAFLNLFNSGFTVTNGAVCVTSPTAPACGPGGGQVPEPGTTALLAIGFAALTWRRRWASTRQSGPILHAAS